MASDNIYRKDANKQPSNCAFPGCDRPIAHSADEFADETCDQHRTQDYKAHSLEHDGPARRPKKFVAEARVKPCPSCSPATRRQCDVCDGTGVAQENPNPVSAQTVGVGIFPTLERGGGENVNESFTQALLESIAEEDAEEIVSTFRATFSEKVGHRLAEMATLQEVYLDSTDHPEVKELIRQGFRLKKSTNGRDVLEGPNGQRKIIHTKGGKIHVVSEDAMNEAAGDQIPCDHCDENGYSQKYKATCRVCKGTKLRSPYQMPEDYARTEDFVRNMVLDQMKARGQEGINFDPLRHKRGPSVHRRLYIKSNKGLKEDVVSEGTVAGMWDTSDEYIGYHGISPDPAKGKYIYGHVPTSKIGFAETAKEAREKLKQLHFGHVGQEVTIREEFAVLDEVSKTTLKSYIDKAFDDFADKKEQQHHSTIVANKNYRAGNLPAADYYDDTSSKRELQARKRKDGIVRAVAKLTKEEVQLNEIGDTPEGKKRLHKYISFAKDDLLSANLNRDQDLDRAIRHEDEAAEAKTDEDREFHNDRAKAFSHSAANTDKSIVNRKKGITNAAKRLLKAGGNVKEALENEEIAE